MLRPRACGRWSPPRSWPARLKRLSSPAPSWPRFHDRHGRRHPIRLAAPAAPVTIELIPVSGIGEIRPGDDLAATIAARAELRQGDVVVVTQKVVSKAE